MKNDDLNPIYRITKEISTENNLKPQDQFVIEEVVSDLLYFQVKEDYIKKIVKKIFSICK